MAAGRTDDDWVNVGAKDNVGAGTEPPTEKKDPAAAGGSPGASA